MTKENSKGVTLSVKGLAQDSHLIKSHLPKVAMVQVPEAGLTVQGSHQPKVAAAPGENQNAAPPTKN